MFTGSLQLRYFRLPASLPNLLAICLLSLIVCPPLSAAAPVDHPAGTTATIFDEAQLYKNAKDYYYRLERDPSIGRERSNWLMGVRNFRRIYQSLPNGSRAPSCLYMMARMYRRMYQRFELPIDLDEAVNYYQKVITLFPDDTLADDALFAKAEIFEKEKKDPKQAAELYIKITREFKGGDKYALAVNRLRGLAATKKVILPEQLRKTEKIEKLVNLLPVKYWSSDDYTRVVIRASEPVHYSSSLLEKDGDRPRRLYLDFARSYIPPEFRAPVPIEDGLLKQVRTGQFNSSTVRVVLDIESISDYKIFSLNDPFRVIVDVRGMKKKTAKIEQKDSEPPKNAPVISQPTVPESWVILKDNKKKKPVSVAAAGRKKRSRPPALTLAQQLGLGIKTIILDPGHGGKDPGAMAFGMKEKDIVLKVARKLKKILSQQYNFDVRMTRNSDTFLSLEERTALANTTGADLFLSIHVNAHPDKSAHGVETFFLNLATNAEAMRVAARENATTTHNISDMQTILSDLMQNSKINESSRLAEFVQTNLTSGLERRHYPVKDLGVKQAPFYVLIGAQMPSILAEISFITNPKEAELLRDDTYLEGIAEEIAAGVMAYVQHHTSAALIQ